MRLDSGELDVGIEDARERIDDVLGRQLVAVVESHALAQLER